MTLEKTEEEIVNMISEMIKPEIKGHSKISLKHNKSSYNSIVVNSEKTAYRFFNTSDMLLARIKSDGNVYYISFPSVYKPDFDMANIHNTSIKSESEFIRIDLSLFISLFAIESEYNKLSEIITKIFVNLFSFPSFGCCSLYEKCSDAGHCLHIDMAYSTACMYRKNLECGKIFYGKNKNT